MVFYSFPVISGSIASQSPQRPGHMHCPGPRCPPVPSHTDLLGAATHAGLAPRSCPRSQLGRQGLSSGQSQAQELHCPGHLLAPCSGVLAGHRIQATRWLGRGLCLQWEDSEPGQAAPLSPLSFPAPPSFFCTYNPSVHRPCSNHISRGLF